LAQTAQVILIVDDHPPVLRSTAGTSSETGYRVLVAENGADGLAVFLDHANEIVLVISDVVMPQMDGIELAARSRLERRRIKLILMTGYAAATLTSGIGGAIPLLRKPFLPEELLQTVRLALNG
jgi:CheY-like chemotaxis protein